ncbi:MAG: hypothetical protein ABIO37_12345 [Caulobacteraceae bacterium]
MNMRLLHCAALSLALLFGTADTSFAGAPVGAPKPVAPNPARLADGKPNWTGFWTVVGGLLDRNFGPGYVAPEPSGGAQNAGNRTRGISELKSPYKEKYEALLAASAKGMVLKDPAALCNPAGMPRMMNMTYGMEFLQVPGMIAVTSEYGPFTRRIWMDGRKHPPEDELDPTFSGHSIGRWEGDTLVVDTVGLRDDTLIDQSGLMHSDQMHLVERWSQTEPGVLTVEITVSDPKVFTKPWKIVKRYGHRPDLNIQEYNCLENNRNVGDNGQPTF